MGLGDIKRFITSSRPPNAAVAWKYKLTATRPTGILSARPTSGEEIDRSRNPKRTKNESHNSP